MGNSDQDSSENSLQRRELLLKVYDASLLEYRYNVTLGWERTKFYLSISVTAIAAGVGLMRLASDSIISSIFLSIYFLALVVIAVLALRSAEVSKKYYREAILTKTLVEKELGLLKQIDGFEEQGYHLGIAVTPGMRNWRKVLFGHETRREKSIDSGSLVSQTQTTIKILIGIELVGSFLSIINIILRTL